MDGLMRTDEEIIRDINDIIKRQVQPAVEMHGGVVTLEKYEDGVATMFMSGACSGCASSEYTLQQGILQLLQHYIPEIKNVQKIEDPNSTVDPYFS